MTSSRSSLSPRSKGLTWLAALGLALIVSVTSAEAGRRRRVVVLPFEGPKAATFHAAVVKLIKTKHTVVSLKVWNRAADQLDATKRTEKNLRTIARKLKVDGVVTGEVEKRRDAYQLRLKLKAGTTGELVGRRVDIKSRGVKLGARPRREIKEELIAAIDEIEMNRGGTDVAVADDERGDDDQDDVQPNKKRSDAVAMVDDDEPAPKPRRSSEQPDETDDASVDDDDDATDDDQPDARDRESASASEKNLTKSSEFLTPTNRAIDVVLGASLSMRRLSFRADADLTNAPPSYRQDLPVPGAVIDAVIYPLAFGKTRTGFLSGLGLELSYDRVLLISSKRRYVDAMMQQQTAELSTTQSRLSVGAVLRYPVGQRFAVGAKALYSIQGFDIAQQLPNGASADIPSVGYAMIEPKLFIHVSPIPALSFSAEGGAMLVSKSGEIENAVTGYGPASTSGFEGSVGVDYNVTRNIFVRVLARLERFSLTFKGDPSSLSHTRDGDVMQDVQGATDLYYGGAATLGYAY